MRFLAVDDEPLLLDKLVNTLKTAKPEAEILSFLWAADALEAAKSNPIDVAFLDIQMGGMSGLELAGRLKKIKPDIHIIFVTGYSQYAVNAFAMHATGYLLKPVDEADIIRELTFVYGEKCTASRIRIQTFGGFDVFVNDTLLKFERQKAKELLAFLVDRRGASVTTGEAYAVLFENESYSVSKRTYFRNIVKSLKDTLKSANADEILAKGYNSLAVVPDLFECDYYNFLNSDPVAINFYQNDYLPAYSWAESHNAELGFSKLDIP